MPSASLLATWLLVAASVPTWLYADSVLEYEIHVETSSPMREVKVSDSRRTTFVGQGRARSDNEMTSYVFRADLGKLWVLFHHRRAYWEFDTPVRLEDLVPEEARSLFAKGKKGGAALVEMTETDEAKRVGMWRAKRWKVEVLQPLIRVSRTQDLWLDTDSGIDLSSYRELKRNAAALSVLDEEWIAEILALDGLAVLTEEKTEFPNRTEESTITLVSHTEKDVDDSYYGVPDGYVPEEFDAGALFAVAEPVEQPAAPEPRLR